MSPIVGDYGMSHVNFKGFSAYNAHRYWNAVRKIYKEGDSKLPKMGHECTYLFHWLSNLDKVTHEYMKASLQFHHKQLCKDYKDVQKQLKKSTLNIMWFDHGGCHLELPRDKTSLDSLNGLVSSTFVRGNGVVIWFL